jgi:hypothetical protein
MSNRRDGGWLISLLPRGVVFWNKVMFAYLLDRGLTGTLLDFNPNPYQIFYNTA